MGGREGEIGRYGGIAVELLDIGDGEGWQVCCALGVICKMMGNLVTVVSGIVA